MLQNKLDFQYLQTNKKITGLKIFPRNFFTFLIQLNTKLLIRKKKLELKRNPTDIQFCTKPLLK